MTNWDSKFISAENRGRVLYPEQSIATGYGGLVQRVSSIGFLIRGNRHKLSKDNQTEIALDLVNMAVICKRMFEGLNLASDDLYSLMMGITEGMENEKR
jgi:hypothetical protein